MRPVRRTGLLLVALGVLVPAAPAGALREGALTLRIAVGDHHVRATPGSTCRRVPTEEGADRGECKEVAYPLRTRGRLDMRPGARVRMRFATTPSQVKWRLLDSATAEPATVLSGSAHRRPESKRRFVFHLPAKLPCAAVLNVFVLYRDGPAESDVDFWAATRTRACVRR
jgi:hypothetical protein